ncbi:MAG: hypothetical protein ACOX1V_05025 [Candidatus Iainarchaeum sp.]|nr:MAG: hypothetical protein BWY55_00171 [archaeon ADurb.Bin336]
MNKKKTSKKEVIKKELIEKEINKKVVKSSEEVSPKNEVVTKKKQEKQNFFQENKTLLIFASVMLFLVILFLIYSIFLSNPFKYSFNINGVDFVSNEFTPSSFFKEFRKNESFLVSVDVVDNSSNAWVVNSMNLWLVALNADKKETLLVVRNVDSKGILSDCLTNDANVLNSRVISKSECEGLLNDINKARIIISLSNKNFVLFEKNKLSVFASGVNTISGVNYVVIKEMYSNFDDVLTLINQKIGSVN